MTKLTRAEWQKLAEAHLVAAQALIAAGCWADAYYLAGYVVECGLKACIVKRVAAEPELIFDEKRFSDKCWSHDFAELVDQAGLKTDYEADRLSNPALRTNWDGVMKWKETTRYDSTISQTTAEDLVVAITDATNGVLPWIKNRW